MVPDIERFKIQKFDSLESTNKHCELLDLRKVEEFTCIWALEQTAGIGQRGNSWASAAGQNLTFSLLLKPTFLPADRQFRLTQALSLGVTDLIESLDSIKSTVSIKWPNDIYVEGKKICGTLTTARISDGSIATAVCGIGVNVNQTEFPDWVPNPTSIRLLTGQHYALEPLLHNLLAYIAQRYEALRRGYDPSEEYLSQLLNYGIPKRYLYSGNEITATITGVDRHGRLLLTTESGLHLCCAMKEIALLP